MDTTYKLKWAEVYAYASALIPPAALPPDPANRINISPSRLRRKAVPDSMVWETLLRDGGEADAWLHADKKEALALLRPFGNETMGVEAVPMGIKIPGNENVELPAVLLRP